MKTNSYYKKQLAKFSIGQQVEVYSLIGCKDFIGIKTIDDIAPMNSSPDALPMIWFKEGGGAHHVGAIAKLSKARIEELNK